MWRQATLCHWAKVHWLLSRWRWCTGPTRCWRTMMATVVSCSQTMPLDSILLRSRFITTVSVLLNWCMKQKSIMLISWIRSVPWWPRRFRRLKRWICLSNWYVRVMAQFGRIIPHRLSRNTNSGQMLIRRIRLPSFTTPCGNRHVKWRRLLPMVFVTWHLRQLW